MTGSTAQQGETLEPPEVEAELVEPARATTAGPEPGASQAPVKKRRLWPIGVAAVATMAVAGAGYYAVTSFLKGKGDAAPGAPEPHAATGLAETADEAPAPIVLPVPDPVAPDAALTGAAEVVPSAGDRVPTSAPSAAATVDRGAPAASAAPISPDPGAAPDSAPSEAPAGEAAPEPAVAIDPLAELQAEAERLAAREAEGAAAGAALVLAPPPETGAAGAGAAPADVIAELKALRALFETETSRLATELAAERSRAAAQADEIAALRAGLAVMERAQAASAEPATPEVAARGQTAPRVGGERATLIVMALARAIETGKPYKVELARAEALAPDAPAIARLRVDAADGVPTLAALKARFPADLRRALAADAGKGGGVMGRFSAGVAELVSVRPAGPVKGAGAGAVLSRAEAALAADDVDGALGELKALQGPARDAMAAFVAEAQRLSSARASLADLNAFLIDAASG
jgi:hypothetical protein